MATDHTAYAVPDDGNPSGAISPAINGGFPALTCAMGEGASGTRVSGPVRSVAVQDEL